MAINWDLWGSGLQNRFNDIENGQYDWSFITPEVVQGFNKYTAQRKLKMPKIVEKFEKALKEKDKYTDDELFEYAFNKELDKRKDAEKERVYRPDTMIGGTVKPATWEQNKNTSIGDWNTAWTKVPGKWAFNRNDGRKTDEEIEKELRREWGELTLPEVEIGSPDSGRIQRSMADGTYPEHVAGEIVTEEPKTEFKAVSEYGFEDVPDTDEYSLKTPIDENQWTRLGLDKEALREELFKERYGSDYDDHKAIYDQYGKLTPYQRMIKAGEAASYWDPEAGKIFINAGQRMHDENIKAWEQVRKTAESNRDYALKMFQVTDGHPGWLASAMKWQNEMTELDKSNPQLTGKDFTGLDEKKMQMYGTGSVQDDAVSAVWNEVLKGFVKGKNGKLRFMGEADLDNIKGFSELSPMDQDFVRKKARKTFSDFRKSSKEQEADALTRAKANEPLYKKWLENYNNVYNGSVIDFNAKTGTRKDGTTYNYYSPEQAAQAFVYLNERGVPLDQIFEAVPAFKDIRRTLFHDGKLDVSKVGQAALASAFSSLQAKGLWEENSGAIMNMARDLYAQDIENQKKYGEQMRRYIEGGKIDWRGTQFDPDMDFDPNSEIFKGAVKTKTDVGAAGADEATSTNPKFTINKKDVQPVKDVKVVDGTAGAVSTHLAKGDYEVLGDVEINGEKYKQLKVTGGSYITTVDVPTEEYEKGKISQVFVVKQDPRVKNKADAKKANNGGEATAAAAAAAPAAPAAPEAPVVQTDDGYVAD